MTDVSSAHIIWDCHGLLPVCYKGREKRERKRRKISPEKRRKEKKRKMPQPRYALLPQEKKRGKKKKEKEGAVEKERKGRGPTLVLLQPSVHFLVSPRGGKKKKKVLKRGEKGKGGGDQYHTCKAAVATDFCKDRSGGKEGSQMGRGGKKEKGDTRYQASCLDRYIFT